MSNLFYENLQDKSDGTYEKEIRDKAIDEFTEALIKNINQIPSKCIGGANVRRIAEQMKEGEG